MKDEDPEGGADEIFVSAYSDIEKADIGTTQAHLVFSVGGDTTIEWDDPRLEAPVRVLFGPGLSLAALEAAIADDAMAEAALRLMNRLVRGRLIVWWYGTPERRLMEIVPLHGNVDARRQVGDIGKFTLSDFAVLTWRDGQPTISHPDADALLKIAPAGYRLLPGLMAHGRGDVDGVPPLPPEAASFLASCGFLSDPSKAPAARTAWSPEEWLYHRRTRDTGQLALLTMADRSVAVEKPPPRQAPAGQGIKLPTVPDSPLGQLMDIRESYREPGPNPLRRDDLGAMLWRVARHRTDRFPIGSGLAVRNQPGGGALGELEYYVAINRCDGLERGFYFYDGYQHLLAPISGPNATLDRYLAAAAKSLLLEDAVPDSVIVLTTQHARLSGKYKTLAYRLTLMHVGCAYEALYLAATELGLSPCGIGASDMGYFQSLTGLEPHEETSVGEFALSGRQVVQ